MNIKTVKQAAPVEAAPQPLHLRIEGLTQDIDDPEVFVLHGVKMWDCTLDQRELTEDLTATGVPRDVAEFEVEKMIERIGNRLLSDAIAKRVRLA